MPDTQEILNRARGLEPHVWAQEEEPEGDEVWRGRAYGARFELTRPGGRVLSDQPDTDSLMLTLRGALPGQERLQKEFWVALGTPSIITSSKRFRNPRILIWNDARLALEENRTHDASDLVGQILDGLTVGQRLFPRTLIKLP